MTDVFCEPCGLTLTSQNYQFHVTGKKHKQREATLAQLKNIEETGLFIRGIPLGVQAGDVVSVFEKFGEIVNVQVHRKICYLNFADRNSREEAIKHEHYLNNTLLDVKRRICSSRPQISSSSSGNVSKRDRDRSTETPTVTPQHIPPKKTIDNVAILNILSQPAPFSDQFSFLKNTVLAGNEQCHRVMTDIINSLYRAFKPVFSTCELYPFGSMITGLAFVDSDLDIYAFLEVNKSTHMLTKEEENTVFRRAKGCLFRSKLVSNIVPIQSAKTPIIKFIHIGTSCSCDLSFRDPIGHCNSSLLRHYLSMNERFFDLIFFLKYWARVHEFCSSSKFSNFALCMLGLSFLLSLKNEAGDKLLPSVHDLLQSADTSEKFFSVKGWRCAFNSSPITLTLPDTAKFSMPHLLKDCFQYIANIPFESHVVSVLTGDLISRGVFQESPDNLPDAYECYKTFISNHPDDILCEPHDTAVIHDPFKLNHNLVKRVSKETLNQFTEACKDAAAICEKNPDGQKLLLELLTVRSPPKEVRAKVFYVKLSPECSEGNLINLIKNILRKILLLNLEEVGRDESTPTKVSKEDSMVDIHEKCSQVLTFLCCGFKDVWNRRKMAKKLLRADGVKLGSPLSFEDEEKVTNILAEKGALVDMKFYFKLTFSKTNLHIQMQNLKSGRDGWFNSFENSVGFNLTQWIKLFSEDSKNKCQATSSQESVA